MDKQNELYNTNDYYCGAKTRASGGHPCKLRAGFGTDHVGTGRCKFHGGRSTGPKDKNKVKKNKNAEKHGLFSKYLPEETLELVNSMEDLNSLDMLWDNIKIQYAAIIRAQKIMFVKGKEELVKELKKKKETSSEISEEEFEIQFSWDRHERFLTSQARAMNNLTNMIAKYEDLSVKSLATEEQIVKIEKIKAEVDRIKGVSEDIEDIEFLMEEINE